MRSLLPFLSTCAALAADVTFHRDVAPILQARCQGCHRPGEAAPMAFLTYEGTRPFAKAIREAVLAKRMPPWSGEGHAFRNDPRLSAAEISTLTRWADSGAQEGEVKNAPPARPFLEGWNIGKPDMVISMPRPFRVPAAGVVEYQHIVVPTGFTEDRWVSAVEIRPGNRAVVHHVIALVREPGSKWLAHAKPGEPVTREPNSGITTQPAADLPEFLLSYTPGRPPAALAEGQARLIKAGSDLIFQLHYTPNGQETLDQSKIGLIFAKAKPRERVATLPISNRAFAIPPGEPNHRVTSTMHVAREATVQRLIPHMHLRGKAFQVDVVKAGGERETLLRVPKYDFRWQHAYELKEPVKLAEGSRIDCTAWYDNSPNNPDNPDPKQTVRWGDQSWDEMMLNYVDVAVAPDSEPRNVLARPAAQQGATSVKEKFYGVYRLVKFTNEFKDGRVEYPYGPNAMGRITYDRAGRMSALLMNPDRPKPANVPVGASAGSWRTAPEAEIRAVINGFVAYNGLFDVDESKGIVIHHVKSALNPNWVGSDLIRSYKFDGKLLTLSVEYAASRGVLVWEREPD